jgi:hypothetical protein
MKVVKPLQIQSLLSMVGQPLIFQEDICWEKSELAL